MNWFTNLFGFGGSSNSSTAVGPDVAPGQPMGSGAMTMEEPIGMSVAGRGSLESTGGIMGYGRGLSAGGLERSMRELGVGPAELWTLINVETRGFGYLANRNPVILFERHIFHRETGGRFDAAAPEVSNSKPGGYRGGTAEYPRLVRAASFDFDAALRSASWGLGQVMGFNSEPLEYDDVQAMVTLMRQSENDQLNAVVRFLLTEGVDVYLRNHQWADFALRYNGPRYRDNSYDTRLAAEYEKFSAGAVPNVGVRAAQLYLTYLEFSPNGIDGIFGARTKAAVADYLTARGEPAVPEDITEEIAVEQVPRLEADAALLPDEWPF